MAFNVLPGIATATTKAPQVPVGASRGSGLLEPPLALPADPPVWRSYGSQRNAAPQSNCDSEHVSPKSKGSWEDESDTDMSSVCCLSSRQGSKQRGALRDSISSNVEIGIASTIPFPGLLTLLQEERRQVEAELRALRRKCRELMRCVEEAGGSLSEAGSQDTSSSKGRRRSSCRDVSTRARCDTDETIEEVTPTRSRQSSKSPRRNCVTKCASDEDRAAMQAAIRGRIQAEKRNSAAKRESGMKRNSAIRLSMNGYHQPVSMPTLARDGDACCTNGHNGHAEVVKPNGACSSQPSSPRSEEVVGAVRDCPVCGNTFMPDAQFCRKCGNRRPEESLQESNITPPTPGMLQSVETAEDSPTVADMTVIRRVSWKKLSISPGNGVLSFACGSCGEALERGAHFCAKCGEVQILNSEDSPSKQIAPSSNALGLLEADKTEAVSMSKQLKKARKRTSKTPLLSKIDSAYKPREHDSYRRKPRSSLKIMERRRHSIRVYSTNDDENEETDKRWWEFVFNPDGSFIRFWNISTMLALLWVIASCSVRLGIPWFKPAYFIHIIEYLVEGFFYADILVTFNTGFVLSGHLHTDRRDIARHYLSFWFWIDVAANLPLEMMLSISKDDRKSLKFIKWAKLPKLLRLNKLQKFTKGQSRWMPVIYCYLATLVILHFAACGWIFVIDPCSHYDSSDPYYNWNFASDVDEELVSQDPLLGWECRQDRIGSIYLQAIHIALGALFGADRVTYGGWMSSGLTASGLAEEIASYAAMIGDSTDGAHVDPNLAAIRAMKLLLLRGKYPLGAWTEALGAGAADLDASLLTSLAAMGFDGKTFATDYSMALNFYGSLVLALGITIQALLFAEFSKLVMTRRAAEEEFRKQHDVCKKELEMYAHLLPERLQERVEKYFQYRWLNQAYGPLKMTSSDVLSPSLREEVALNLYGGILSSFELLQGLTRVYTTKMCLHVSQLYYMKGDSIFQRDHSPIGLLVISQGVVALTNKVVDMEDAACFSFLTKMEIGDAFGEVGTISLVAYGGKRPYKNDKWATAMTVCQLICMPTEALQEMVRKHPRLIMHFRKKLDNMEEMVSRRGTVMPTRSPVMKPCQTLSERRSYRVW
eukprot:TRINITY_DN5749_c0_g2_i1.p1 TRINITY_DN5749_c0_g2~~TRINITY_DN5749_c0_g2_i1.p1  ORF type:complete len:1105 (+),score=224.49 TRINITY_DN5749_c0_g2_i1:161-3475(+)